MINFLFIGKLNKKLSRELKLCNRLITGEWKAHKTSETWVRFFMRSIRVRLGYEYNMAILSVQAIAEKIIAQLH